MKWILLLTLCLLTGCSTVTVVQKCMPTLKSCDPASVDCTEKADLWVCKTLGLFN